MTYMLVTQNGLMMPIVSVVVRFKILDGSLTIWRINSKGTIMESCEGTVINGKFQEE
jgi:hypothetical protein